MREGALILPTLSLPLLNVWYITLVVSVCIMHFIFIYITCALYTKAKKKKKKTARKKRTGQKYNGIMVYKKKERNIHTI